MYSASVSPYVNIFVSPFGSRAKPVDHFIGYTSDGGPENGPWHSGPPMKGYTKVRLEYLQVGLYSRLSQATGRSISQTDAKTYDR
jgi:hypothetical protein